MIYIDTSVVLAQVFAEDRIPETKLWGETLVASRLLEYEVWNRVHARGVALSHSTVVSAVLNEIAFLEMTQTVLARAREPFPLAVRTLDALHLASLLYLQEQSRPIRIATYDERMLACAARLNIEAWPL